jgi:hypothetical protein
MNLRTAKLLKKSATAEGKNPSEIKRWWLGLNWRERTVERKRLRTRLEEE